MAEDKKKAGDKGYKGEKGAPGVEVPDTAPKVQVKDSDKEFEKLVKETLKGAHGTGRERMLSLGVNYAKVQTEVNKRNRNK